jgi:excisionase family DNA binding protein
MAEHPDAANFPLSFHLATVIFCYQIIATNLFQHAKIMEKFDKWLTIDELANYIKMSRTKLYGMAQRGEVPASKIGNQWRFDREEIDRWMKAHATGKGEMKG